MKHATPPIIPIILCGGQGSRLWPLSRKYYPKQFLELTEGGSLLQETIKRVHTLQNVVSPIIICNEAHYFLTQEQLKDIEVEPACIILEPDGKSTAPAATVAAMQASQQFQEDALLLVMPADHFIADKEIFQQAVATASQHAGDNLLTFGITPTSPKTGYGYIKLGEDYNNALKKVTQFTEKPDQKHAEEYLKSGNYLWNSGMFLFKARTFLEEVQQLSPDIYSACKKAFSLANRDKSFLRLTRAGFQDCPENSIDYAIMEKTSRALVLPLTCGWADMGDWATIAEINNGNAEGNVLKGDVLTEDVSNCCLYANNRLIAAVGIKDQVVVETQDAILIADKNRTQDVKRIVAQLQQLSHQAAEVHQRVFRPWGYYEFLTKGENYLVKHIMLKPHSKLTLQMHLHRSEHWVVVRGSAQVECDQKQFVLGESESTYIPRACKHRLSNLGEQPLHIIEVQTGDYLNEKDIVRFDELEDEAISLTTAT